MANSKDDNKCNYYHQTMELHLDYGAETLRRIIETKLESQNVSLRDYLNKRHASAPLGYLKKRGVLRQDQWELVYPSGIKEPELACFDITLLTMLLLQTNLSLSADEKKKVMELRGERNHMSHLPKAELNDKTHFNVSSTIITDLSNIVGKNFTKEIKQSISELQKREVVSCRSNLEVVNIRNEELMVKLIEKPSSQTADASDTTLLRFGLTKWTKQFSRTIDLETFLCRLKDKRVLTQTEKMNIENEYNKEEQSSKLIMKMVDETNENLWEFCRCLRRMDENLSNLIENKNTDGADTESNLKAVERNKISKIIQTYFKKDETGSVPCEEIHFVVEEELHNLVDYSIIEQILLQEFKTDETRIGDYRFHGIISKGTEDVRRKRTSFYKNITDTDLDDDDEDMSETSCDTLAEYACKRLEKIKPGFGPRIKHAITEECITPKLFMNMTHELMKTCFRGYLNGMPFGILMELEEIQKELRRKRIKTSSNTVDPLRKFDTPTDKLVYKKGHVRPAVGNLIVPAHEFRMLPTNGEFTNLFIVKECIKFIAACMNTRKNGTIHFGIKGMGNGLGLVCGVERIPDASKTSHDFEIIKGIETCFQHDQVPRVKRCIRPFQVVPVEDGSVILEMDVVPFSGYTDSDFFPIQFPPKGNQDEKLFVYNNDSECEIHTVPADAQEDVIQLYKVNLLKERVSLEGKNKKMQDCNNSLASQLVSVLTAGSDYVTDQYTPIICSGKLTGCERENDIRETFDITEAFLSSVAVFDFDSSVSLRSQVEKQDTIFRVITANQSIPEESIGSERIWMYCNGNTDLHIEEMNLKDWYKHRFNGVKDAISLCRQKTPQQRAIVIFLAYTNTESKDPLLELAEDCIKSKFRDQCVVIADSDETVSQLKKKLLEIMPSDDVVKYFHTGMKWEDISNTLRTVFRTSTQYDYKLPCSNGHFVLMTSEEKRQLNFTDIDILSGEECKREEMIDDDETRRKRKTTEQENFYRGRDVSWWNFHYTDQVGKRDLHSKYLQSVKKKLKFEGDKLIETEKIWHQPGAGGSTAGRYLLWNLSQFDNCGYESAYRCCVIKQITENTAKQIYSFLSFKDESPKPVVILTDNENEENRKLLHFTLDEQAYKNGEANKLFCLHIAICRVPVSYKKTNKEREHVLRHELSKTEQSWFETKYKELEDSEIDVKTLISFNVMRKNFDKKYIKELADTILHDVTDTERDVLKCLSLVNTFDRGSAIPISTFDCLVTNPDMLPSQYNIWLLKNKGPFGLVAPMSGARNITNARTIWNVDMTDELALLIKKVCDGVIQSGVMIISQALAKAILDYIMRKENICLQDLILFVLRIVKNHVGERNPMSKHFVKIINCLFKTRQMLTEKGEIKNKFSDMVMALKEIQIDENESQANERVVNVMKNCFDITSDAMVGQQLARFLIHMRDFEQAELVILKSLKLQPNSSYLLDTHGQIYKSKMENLINQKDPLINNEDAAHIVDIALTAIDKFVQGQECAVTSMEVDGGMNNNCFYMEVKTILILLEKFDKFACYQSRTNFLTFLNKHDVQVDSSTFNEVARLCPMKQLRKNSEKQMHLEESLRILEEREYQIKRHFYLVYTSADEKLLLKLRERYENFYGTEKERSKLQFLYGIGLKSLMHANKAEKQKLETRVIEAKRNLQRSDRINKLKTADKRDLLVLLGFEIIQMSDRGAQTRPMNVPEYQLLLRYSERLLEEEQSSSRPYLEAYLYYAILHWPSTSRLRIEKLRIENLCKPTQYANRLRDWKKDFDANFKVKSNGEYRMNKPKNYFVLGKGELGGDLVDLECIRKEWKSLKQKTENRKKPPVKADNFWKEPFVVERLQRLTGILDDSGKTIQYEDKNDLWDYRFSIRTYYPNPHLGNRLVTFVLGFTWADLAAFDVEEKGNDDFLTSKKKTVVSQSNGKTDKKSAGAAGESAEDASGTEVPNSRNKTTLEERTDQTDDSALGAVGGENPEPDFKGSQCYIPDDLTRALQDSVFTEEQSEVGNRLRMNCVSHGLAFRGNTPGNGNCFFEAISCQLDRLGLPRRSPETLRASVTEYIRKTPNYEGIDGEVSLDDFVEQPFEQYCEQMSRNGTYADHVVVIGMARMLKHDILIVTSSPSANANDSITWVIGKRHFGGDPMLLGHFWENHYQSLKPIGEADKETNLMNERYQGNRTKVTDATETAMEAVSSLPNNSGKNPVELLNDRRKGLKLKYELVSESKGGSNKVFTMSVDVDKHTFEGQGSSKKLAKQEAARTALTKIFGVQSVSESYSEQCTQAGKRPSSKKKDKKKRR